MDDSQSNVFRVFGTEFSLPHTTDMSPTKMNVLMVSTLLFAKNGYAAVSMRDIATELNIKAASLYNHFSGKEELFDAVLDHARDLYLLYFQQLDMQIQDAQSFQDVLDILFREPEKMDNTFTNYAFGLVQAEQFRSDKAADIYLNVFLKYSIHFISKRFEHCIEKGWVTTFDTNIMATAFIHSVMQGINVRLQMYLGRAVPYEPGHMIAELHQFFLHGQQMPE